MVSEKVDPIDWSHTPPLFAVQPELKVLPGVNAAYKSQDLVHQPELERVSTGMPDQRTTCAATQGIMTRISVSSVHFKMSTFFATYVYNKFTLE